MFFSVIEQALHEAQSFISGYPDFVYMPVTGGIRAQCPVLVYHTIDAHEFNEHLIYLGENSYQTLSTDDYVKRLQEPPGKGIDTVLLTVDDGRSSFWRYGYPLLKRYGLKATLFIIPGRTLESDKCRRNLEDVWAGRCSADDVHGEDPEDVTLCTWAEIRKMHNSGLVDIQSHSLFHGEVFSEPVLKGFIDEATPFAAYETPVTPYLGLQHAGKALVYHEFHGLPLYMAAPLYLGGVNYRPSGELMEFCRQFFLKESVGGGQMNGWKGRLRGAINTKFPDGGLIRKTGEEIAREIHTDITEAAAMIKQKVDRNAGEHFCLPYSIGSELAVKLVKKAGMKSCFWGIIAGRRANLTGEDPWHLVRIKSDFLWRLPGKGRRSLLGTYWRKVGRRLRGQRFY